MKRAMSKKRRKARVRNQKNEVDVLSRLTVKPIAESTGNLSIGGDLLKKSIEQLKVGDWDSLTQLDNSDLESYQEHAELALLAGLGSLQLGKVSDAKRLFLLAKKWGSSNKKISRILISGVYNTLGRAACISGKKVANEYFENSIKLSNFDHSIPLSLNEVRRLTCERVESQTSQVGLPLPKVLMIDSTPVGHASATGQLKQTFLKNWTKSSFLQIWEKVNHPASTLHMIELGQPIEDSRNTVFSIDDLLDKCRLFNPDVVYFRPVDLQLLFEVAERIVSELGKPLVIHMMDDWPERLHSADSIKYTKLDASLRSLLLHTTTCLSICDHMSTAYKARYGGDWIALANGADPSDFKTKSWAERSLVSDSPPFVIRYMGGLADDMTLDSVKDIAEAVDSLQKEVRVSFEIFTMDWCIKKAKLELESFSGVSVNPLVDLKNYHTFLSESDALVIAYNFDSNSIDYVRLSLANKMPECLASGAPLLVYGPPEIATIDYLRRADCTKMVEVRDQIVLCNAIKELVLQPDVCQALSEKARDFVGQNLKKKNVQKQFLHHMIRAKCATKVSGLIH